MAIDLKSVFKKGETHNVVFDYHPKEFPLVVSKPANDFVQSSTEKSSDFKINELIAEQAGIAQLNRKSIEDKIEELALERLKSVEEKAYKQAYELGLIEGTAKAFEENKEHFLHRVEKLDEILAAFENIKNQILNENEAEFIKLINMIATKIAVKEVQADREIFVELMVKIVEESQALENLVIKLSNDDLAFIEKMREKWGRKADFLKRVKLEPSDEVESGGCVLETNYGVIDATLAQRVEKVWQALESKLPCTQKVNDDGEKA